MARKPKKRKIYDEYVTQQEFADYWGITQARVSQLMARGELPRGGTKRDWDASYSSMLRRVAAQHKTDEGIDAVKEGALLKRAQREEIQIKLDKERRNLLSSQEVGAVIVTALTITKTKWLAFPSWLRSIMPQMTPRENVQIEDKIREILTELSHERLPTDLRRITEQYFSDLHAAAEANGHGVGGPVPDAEPGK